MARGEWRGWQRCDPTPPEPHLPAAPDRPRPGGAPAARAALAPKCVTGTVRAPSAARARLAPGQRGQGHGCPAVSRVWKALKVRGPGRATGGALRGGQRARDRPGQPPGARRLRFPYRPPRFLPHRGSGDFLSWKLRGSFWGSSPRPSSPPPPLCWGAWTGPLRGGGSGSLGGEVAGGRGVAGHRFAPPCDAVLSPATPRASRACAPAPPRRAPCSCRDLHASRRRPSPRSILASAGR